MNRLQRALIPAALALLLALPLRLTPPPHLDFDYGDQTREPILEGVNNTSSGLAGGTATPDGRALLWKSRDRGGTWPGEVHYVDDGRIPFIGLTNANDTGGYYAGLNLEGFAVENTDNHNLSVHGPHNDGATMRMALATCRTVDDFQALLDSADRRDERGRYGYDYGVIDAYGGATIFECYQFGYTRFDADEAPGGFLVRTNFSYTGDLEPEANPGQFGLHRHNSGMRMFREAVERGEMTALYLLNVVARDLSSEDFDPYPLPLRGYYDAAPYGCISNATAICRSTTTGVTVVQGVRSGERPDDAIMWAINGNPLGGVATPLWVRAGSIPQEYDGANSSRINDRIIQYYNWINSNGWVDTWKLTNPTGTGLWDYLIPLQEFAVAKTRRFVESPRFSYDRLAAFQNEMAQQINDSLWNWKTFYKVTDLATPVFWNNHTTLRWGTLMDDAGDRAVPNRFDVYRSATPFRDGDRGELIGSTADSSFVDENPLTGSAFYQVVAAY